MATPVFALHHARGAGGMEGIDEAFLTTVYSRFVEKVQELMEDNWFLYELTAYDSEIEIYILQEHRVERIPIASLLHMEKDSASGIWIQFVEAKTENALQCGKRWYLAELDGKQLKPKTTSSETEDDESDDEEDLFEAFTERMLWEMDSTEVKINLTLVETHKGSNNEELLSREKLQNIAKRYFPKSTLEFGTND
jgi:hypothetical protein